MTVTLAATSCGGASAPTSDEMTPTARAGLVLSQDRSCGSCHGSNFSGGSAPTWIGLFGSERTMSNGEVVIADRDYLIEAIVEPSARKVKGFNSMMPKISLSDDEVNKIVDYIQYLSE